MKLTPAQLSRAAQVARDIEFLEYVRDNAADTPTDVHVQIGACAQAPMGQALVSVTVSANDIRMKLVEQLTPLYTELRNLGIDLQQ